MARHSCYIAIPVIHQTADFQKKQADDSAALIIV